jgi:integrase
LLLIAMCLLEDLLIFGTDTLLAGDCYVLAGVTGAFFMKDRLILRNMGRYRAAGKDYFVWDRDLAGFGLKVTPNGRQVFIYQYRARGKSGPTKRLTLGKFGDITPTEARTKAAGYASAVAERRDPRSEQMDRRRRADEDAAGTFANLVSEFIERYAKKHHRRWLETERLLQRDAVAIWGPRPATSLTRRDINQHLQTVAERAPIQANQLLANLRKMFNWAVATGRLETSPASGIPRPAPSRARDRVLDDEELARVYLASDQLGYPFGPFYKLLILTAQRVQEVAGMRWGEIRGNQWTIPGERAKNGKAHFVHLSAAAQKVLATLPRADSTDLIFSTNHRNPISGFAKAKANLDERSGVSGWRNHDVRRTVTTGLANLGVPPHVCDKILNHASGTISGVAAVYQKAEFLAERAVALERWGNHVVQLSGERKASGNAV